jgi:hypothetical protein
VKILKARYPGTCPFCEVEILPGHPIVRGAALDGSDDREVYQHVWCAVAARKRFKVASGETFASRAPSSWRRR